jgi:hypothetical protein
MAVTSLQLVMRLLVIMAMMTGLCDQEVRALVTVTLSEKEVAMGLVIVVTLSLFCFLDVVF